MFNCPVCKTGIILPDEEQPQSGTHAYTVVYECGTEIDYAYSDVDYEEITHKCTDGKKITLEERLNEMMVSKKKKEFADLTFRIHDCPQTEIAMIHEMTGYMVKAMEASNEYDNREHRIIKAPELLKAVMKGTRGSSNPMVVMELIRNLHKGTI